MRGLTGTSATKHNCDHGQTLSWIRTQTQLNLIDDFFQNQIRYEWETSILQVLFRKINPTCFLVDLPICQLKEEAAESVVSNFVLFVQILFRGGAENRDKFAKVCFVTPDRFKPDIL